MFSVSIDRKMFTFDPTFFEIVPIEGILRDHMWPIEGLHVDNFKK